MQRNFEYTDLMRQGIVLAELEDTLERASELIQGYRGRLAKRERIKNISVVSALILVFVICIIIGTTSNAWVAVTVIVILFIVGVIIAHYAIKYRASIIHRQSHFLLAVFCRAENNRLYLKKGVELRPGYLGKWIEINIIDQDAHPDIVSYLRGRFLKPSMLQ